MNIAAGTNVFEIKSGIAVAYESPGLRALGHFILRIADREYGVNEHDASMLACSFDEVERRIKDRGKHVIFFSKHPSAGEIADVVYSAIYGTSQTSPIFGLSKPALCEAIRSSRILWAPDGDQAFDDGSYVLHFDVGGQVRLIGFKLGGNALHDPATLSEVWLSAESFYALLQRWRSEFEAAWLAEPKVS
jgi:hypothetical protein